MRAVALWPILLVNVATSISFSEYGTAYSAPSSLVVETMSRAKSSNECDRQQ